MKYRNILTGAVLEISGKISGGAWEEVREPAPKAPAQTTTEAKPKRTGTKKK